MQSLGLTMKWGKDLVGRKTSKGEDRPPSNSTIEGERVASLTFTRTLVVAHSINATVTYAKPHALQARV